MSRDFLTAGRKALGLRPHPLNIIEGMYAEAETAEDREAVRKAALDYMEQTGVEGDEAVPYLEAAGIVDQGVLEQRAAEEDVKEEDAYLRAVVAGEAEHEKPGEWQAAMAEYAAIQAEGARLRDEYLADVAQQRAPQALSPDATVRAIMQADSGAELEQVLRNAGIRVE